MVLEWLSDIIAYHRTAAYKRNYEQNVRTAAEYIRDYLSDQPQFGIVLGSGLGDLANQIERPTVLDYKDIPDFPRPTVEGHEGKLLIGKIEGVPIIGLKGRKHYYEVADDPSNTGMLQVVFPVHVLAELGVPNYFATNAVGGLNLDYKVGDVMIATSHIDLFMPDPLAGRPHDFKRVSDNKQVWRFQPMNDAYHPELRKLLLNAGSKYEGQIHQGQLAAVTGPKYESEGTANALRVLGADAVGMSVIPEAIVARNRGMNVVAMSCITNTVDAQGRNAADHVEVQKVLNAPETRARLSSIIRTFFKNYKDSIQ